MLSVPSKQEKKIWKKYFFILSSFFLSKKLFNSEHDHHSPSRTVCLQRVNIAFTIPRLFKAADIIKQRILTNDGTNFWRKHITWKKWKAKLDAIFKLPCRRVRWTTSVGVYFMVFANFLYYSKFETWTIDQIKAVVNITAVTFLFIFLTRDLGIWVQHLSDKPVMELLSGCIRTVPNCSDFVSSMWESPLCLS